MPFELTVTVSARPSIGDKNLGACSGVPFELIPVDNTPTEIVPLNTLYTWTMLPGFTSTETVKGKPSQLVKLGTTVYTTV